MWELLEKPEHPQLHAFMRRVADEVRANRREPARPTQAPRKSAAGTGRPPQRNDACPCGSGRKFKNCCGRAAAVRGQQS